LGYLLPELRVLEFFGRAEPMVSQRMELVCMRWPVSLKREMERLALLESRRTGRKVGWSELVREALRETYLIPQTPEGPGGSVAG
jgi:hypothetical protein